ncbi:hypothetical protein [Algibacillus agarilyticus]|uniref:hypothetical protein n=1 Tax=Algibacillus agarilyticus TaxID=2234133 RepID=UPI001E607BD4|nr:hypothetical protein [Algibacillus agarilyticus]
MLILIGVWFRYYETTEKDFVKTNFVVQTHHFIEAIQLVHLEWLLLGKPKQISIGQINGFDSGKMLQLNTLGWPILQSHDAAGCQVLWQALLGLPLMSLKKSIDVAYKINNKQDRCEYSIGSETRVKFQYFIQTGQTHLYRDI